MLLFTFIREVFPRPQVGQWGEAAAEDGLFGCQGFFDLDHTCVGGVLLKRGRKRYFRPKQTQAVVLSIMIAKLGVLYLVKMHGHTAARVLCVFHSVSRVRIPLPF